MASTFKIYCCTPLAASITTSRTRREKLRRWTHLAFLRGYRDTFAQLATMETVQCSPASTVAVSMLRPSVEQAPSSAMSTSSMMRLISVIATSYPMIKTLASLNLTQLSIHTTRRLLSLGKAFSLALTIKNGSSSKLGYR